MFHDSHQVFRLLPTCFGQTASDFIHEKFVYMKGATHANSSVHDSLALRAGIWQDFAHLLLGVVRMRGLPARYVSGYLVSGSAGPGGKQEEVIGGQASHAWAEIFLPGGGWFGFDPTLGKPIELRHIRAAYGRDYVDVRFRPALDDSGHEQIAEPKSGSDGSQDSIPERPQQHSQQ